MIITHNVLAQDDGMSALSIEWGYNWSHYTKSDIHFIGDNYNFKLNNVRAKDRQSPFSAKLYFMPATFTIPQYNYSISYIKGKNTFSLGMDHMKYVVVQNQNVLINGIIEIDASKEYEGSYEDNNILIRPDLLDFEHSDGLNYLNFHWERAAFRKVIIENKVVLSIPLGIGLGIYIPKTKVILFGNGMDNRFNIAGYGFSVKSSLKFDFFRCFYLKGSLKSGWVHLPSVLTLGTTNDRAKHAFGFIEEYFTVGGYLFKF